MVKVMLEMLVWNQVMEPACWCTVCINNSNGEVGFQHLATWHAINYIEEIPDRLGVRLPCRTESRVLGARCDGGLSRSSELATRLRPGLYPSGWLAAWYQFSVERHYVPLVSWNVGMRLRLFSSSGSGSIQFLGSEDAFRFFYPLQPSLVSRVR